MKHKPPRPTVVEKIVAKQAQPTIQAHDITNVIWAARRAIGGITGPDFDNVTASISRMEAALAAKALAEQSAPPAAAEASAGKVPDGP